ncbi:MAG: SDR family oxidoreductase [Gemmatimonadota bacterium]|jgi:NAD(P)-dependent dehydrogenase (short-subunit alcohol dehydrogenase family)
MEPPVLIVGGSGGVGSALARNLTRRGIPVHLFARDRGKLEALASEIGGAEFTAVDVMDGPGLKEAVTEACQGERGTAGLAYCVGSIVLKPLKRASEEEFIEAFRLNSVGAALAVQAAEPALRRAGGSVVLFSTIAAGSGFSNHAVTAAAKGATEALTRSLAADLAPDVRVNCVAPSLLRTPLARPLTDNEAMARSIAQLHPLPRLGEAEDAANLAGFLLGPDSSWISGQVISVDGGRSTLRVKG